jgi:hypothetical protein
VGGTEIGVSVTAWTPCVAGACRDVDTPATADDVDGAADVGVLVTVDVTVVVGAGTVTVVVDAGAVTVVVGAGTVTVWVGVAGGVTVWLGVGLWSGVVHVFEPWKGLDPAPNGKAQWWLGGFGSQQATAGVAAAVRTATAPIRPSRTAGRWRFVAWRNGRCINVFPRTTCARSPARNQLNVCATLADA